ncbi:MAG: hypothetical protein KDG55_13690 [Rhodocyclaceae bacterium]|nr:hypothetical protein [Rhodocyclaceae bacterium]
MISATSRSGNRRTQKGRLDTPRGFFSGKAMSCALTPPIDTLVRHRLTRFGFEVLVLGETYDVDRPEDVERCRWEGLFG